MKASEFWKNFRLGEELHIAGAFIYNGLRRFHEMRQLQYPDELFEFLYDLAVGFERLLKICVVLYEHAEDGDQDELEASLITHRHLDLLARLRKHQSFKFGQPSIDLLQLLSDFYTTYRYDRFMLNSAYKGGKEIASFCGFLHKHLQVEFPSNQTLVGIQNEDRYRAFISRTVLRVSQALYKVVRERSGMIGLYTYELRHGSKAESVFLNQVNLADEDILWKELLIFFMNADPESGYLKFLKGIPPLEFDPACVDDYLNCFRSDRYKAMVMDEIEHHYENLESLKGERIELMKVIGASGVCFDDSDDE